jgi:aspartyl-tRNA(Asn)/glutamyl-tRNA(Gln) amidotransferase subunit C
MTIDVETVKKVAFLSRLRVDDDKVEDIKNEFNKILNWVSELSEVNTDGVQPLVSVNQTMLEMRADVVTEGNQVQEILANAPMEEFMGGYITVPKVIE